MKILHVFGNDYASIEFEKKFKGKLVSDIIQEYFIDDNDFEGDFEMTLLEFSSIDLKFIEFLRNNFLDYDMLKHENFYLENQIVQ
jgi:hypothetical protein